MEDDTTTPPEKPAAGRRRRARAPVTIDVTPTPVVPAAEAELPVSPDDQRSLFEPASPDTDAPAPSETASPETGPMETGPMATEPPTPEPAPVASETVTAAEPPSEPAARSGAPRETPPPAPPSPPAAAPLAAPPPRSASAVAGGIVGALIAFVLFLLVAATGLLPIPGGDVADQAANEARMAAATGGALDKRVARLEVASSPAEVKDLAGRLASAEASLKDVAGRVDTLAASPPSAATGSDSAALSALAARIGRLENAPPASPQATPPGLAALPDRVAALEATIKDLSGKVDELAARPFAATDSERAAHAVAIGTLRQAAEKGGPFSGDLAMLEALGSDAANVAALKPLAEKGAPSSAELAARFPAVVDAVLAADNAVGADAGFFDRVVGYARGLVSVRPTAPIAGDTPDAVLSRMQAAASAGDLKTALAEREHLPAAGKDASAAWAADAGARLAIDDLVARLSQSAARPPQGG